MAKVELKNGIIKSLSGRLGNFVYRTLKSGKVVVSPYAARSVPPTDAEISSRQRFAVIAAEVVRRQKEGDTRDRRIIWREIMSELSAS